MSYKRREVKLLLKTRKLFVLSTEDEKIFVALMCLQKPLVAHMIVQYFLPGRSNSLDILILRASNVFSLHSRLCFTNS